MIRPMPASLATARPLIRAMGTVPGRPMTSSQANGGGETTGVGTDVGAGSVGTGVVGVGAAQAARSTVAAIATLGRVGMRRILGIIMRQADAEGPGSSRVGRHEVGVLSQRV